MSKPLVQYVSLDYINESLDLLRQIETPKGASRQDALSMLAGEIARLVKGGYPKKEILKALNRNAQIIRMADIDEIMAEKKPRRAAKRAQQKSPETAPEAKEEPPRGMFVVERFDDEI